ncbi:MAG: hypothetical protein GQ574_17765 [Crocinitomix sp.]|nr:hypothetical protein [Crocinitomix sp.]
MAKCPDCNDIKINIFVDEGDGKCSECRGTGLGNALDQFSSSLVNEQSRCEECNGSGICQICSGSGFAD